MPLVSFFAQAANATNAASAAIDPSTAPQAPAWLSAFPFVLVAIAFYFLLIRPQSLAAKKKEETVKSAKTGDKIVTSSGIHGVISNVKDSTVIVKVSDNVKLEIEKSHIEKIVRAAAGSDTEKDVTVKA